MNQHNTPHVTEINLVKGHEPEPGDRPKEWGGVRQRQPSHPFIEPRDADAPEKLLEPERENIYRVLHEHEERLDALELWKTNDEKSKSIPASFNAPGGFSVTGNWRFVAGIAVLAALILVLYIVMRYGK